MKKILIATGILFGLGVGYCMYQEGRRKKSPFDELEDEKDFAGEATAPVEQSVPAPLGNEFPLRLGSNGRRVERLQVWLLRQLGGTGTVTGHFDKLTEERLQKTLKVKELSKETYHGLALDKPVYEQKSRV